MKRQFQSDEEIPHAAWKLYPEMKEKLDKIIELEEKFEQALNSKKRVCFAMNSEPEIKTKILRVHLRHQFIASTPEEKAFFIISIEGHLLDKSAARMLPFGNYFDKIRIQLDKRQNPSNNVFEWSAENYPEGMKGNCFQVKVPGDKPFPVKMLLHRSNNICPRFEISSFLREVLPFLQVDPTEEQVLLAMWGYISTMGLLDSRDRRQIKCNMALKNLFNVDQLILSSVKQRLGEHMAPCKPIQVEYNVTTTSSTLSDSFGPVAVAKGGGKAFDIEVDVKDHFAFELLESLNDISKSQKEILETLGQMELKANFLAHAIIESTNIINGELKDLQRDPLMLQASSSSSSSSRIAGNPLSITTLGCSRTYSMKPSVPSEVLLRANDPFSLITRRNNSGLDKVKKVSRPSKSSRDNLISDIDAPPILDPSHITNDYTTVIVKDEISKSKIKDSDGDESMVIDSADSDEYEKNNTVQMDIAIDDAILKDIEGKTGVDIANDKVKVIDIIGAPSDLKQQEIIALVEDKTTLIKDEIAAEKVTIDLMPVDDSQIIAKVESLDEGKTSEPLQTVIMKTEEEVVKVDIVKSETEAASSSSSGDNQTITATASSDAKYPVKEGETVAVGVNASTIGVVPVSSQPTKPVIMPRAPDTLSAIHASRGFLDVGNDALFSSSEPWVLATAAILARKKQPGV